MSAPSIHVNNLGVRFRVSYEKAYDLKGRLLGWTRRFLRRQPPKFFHALEDITFDVHDGERIAIIGPNGSGKTTLLRVLSGIYHPDSGEIVTHGKLSPLLALGTGFDLTLDGADNIRLNGLLLGMELGAIEHALPAIVEFADLSDHILKPLKYYSSGMISRLAFSIMVAAQPELVLIDEIFSVGDLSFQRKSENALRDMLAKASIQLIVSHDLNLVTDLCNRALYMRAGRIIADGPVAEVVARYRADANGS